MSNDFLDILQMVEKMQSQELMALHEIAKAISELQNCKTQECFGKEKYIILMKSIFAGDKITSKMVSLQLDKKGEKVKMHI